MNQLRWLFNLLLFPLCPGLPSLQHPGQAIHIRRQRRLKSQGLAADRMAEGQLAGMQRRTRHPQQALLPIKEIAQQRMA